MANSTIQVALQPPSAKIRLSMTLRMPITTVHLGPLGPSPLGRMIFVVLVRSSTHTMTRSLIATVFSPRAAHREAILALWLLRGESIYFVAEM